MSGGVLCGQPMLTFWWGFLGIFSKLIIIDISLETREPFHGQSCRFGCFVSLMKDFFKGGSNIGLNWELCCNFRRLRVHSQGSVMRDDLTDRRRPSGSHPKQISHEPRWGSRSGSVLANQPLSRYPTPQHHHLAAGILCFFLPRSWRFLSTNDKFLEEIIQQSL